MIAMLASSIYFMAVRHVVKGTKREIVSPKSFSLYFSIALDVATTETVPAVGGYYATTHMYGKRCPSLITTFS